MIDPDGCIDCDLCAQICPMDCISSHPERKPAPELLAAAKAKARGRAGADRAAIRELDERVAPFVGATSGVNLQLEYKPDDDGGSA